MVHFLKAVSQYRGLCLALDEGDCATKDGQNISGNGMGYGPIQIRSDPFLRILPRWQTSVQVRAGQDGTNCFTQPLHRSAGRQKEVELNVQAPEVPGQTIEPWDEPVPAARILSGIEQAIAAVVGLISCCYQ